jgi:hypothetical protein
MESIEEESHQRLREACKSFVGEDMSPEMILKIKARCVSIVHPYVDELGIRCLAIDCYDAGDGCVGLRVYDPDL